MKTSVGISGRRLLFALLFFPAAAGATPFDDGLTSRQAWESYLRAETGASHRGAEYWAGQRSQPAPGSCTAGEPDSSFVTGCRAAQRLLAPFDARRRTEPEFRKGWNSYIALRRERDVGPGSSNASLPNRPALTARFDGAKFLDGGPFVISGRNIVGCLDKDATAVLNDPDRDQKYGRALQASALQEGRRIDLPEGLPVLVTIVSHEGLLIMPDVDGGSAYTMVPSWAVVNPAGIQADELPEVYAPRIPYSQATSQRR